MPVFSESSRMKLSQCHPILQKVLTLAIKSIDFAVTEGHRSMERQKELYSQGKSKTMLSKHLNLPSMAVDIELCPKPDVKNPKEIVRYYYFYGIVKGIFETMKSINEISASYELRSGCDWNCNNIFTDEDFLDAYHLEILIK